MEPLLKTDDIPDSAFDASAFNGRQTMFVLALIFAASIAPWAVFVLYMSR